jgi:beta-xylosidase
MRIYLLLFTSTVLSLIGLTSYSQLWNPNLNGGNYKNPIIFADYSDPDILHVDGNFYMVASSFNCMPGIPVLQSKDLVNWKIIGHVYDTLPFERYDKPVHGEGSWAPSIRYHQNTFFVYFCTPHEGLFMAQTKDPTGKWDLHHVAAVEMWEDPCPLWDDDGHAYLVRSKLCGDELYLHKMSQDGTKLLDNGKMIYKDLNKQPVIEGPKFLKKDNYYYILAPAGGVPIGWQTVLRSKDIYGPYETKNVLHQGNTNVNGPHQGGIVETETGEWWFVHFQDRNTYGRIVHLQPVKWVESWPLMGEDINNDGIGEPVVKFKKPSCKMDVPDQIPQTSDNFNNSSLGLQWQWHANPKAEWYSLNANEGNLRLYCVRNITQNGNFWFVPNLLLQKFPAPSFTATVKMNYSITQEGDFCGLTVMGEKWSFIAVRKTPNGYKLGYYEGAYTQCHDLTKEIESVQIDTDYCYLRVAINNNAICSYSYSHDGENYTLIGKEFRAVKGRWIGAKVGLFAINPNISGSSSYADFDWFKIE